MKKNKIRIITIEGYNSDNGELSQTGKSQMNSILNSQILSSLRSNHVVSWDGPRYKDAAKWLNLTINTDCSKFVIDYYQPQAKNQIEIFTNQFLADLNNPLLIADPDFISPNMKSGTVIEIEVNGKPLQWPFTGYKILFADGQLVKN
jgi:hypothetical protein